MNIKVICGNFYICWHPSNTAKGLHHSFWLRIQVQCTLVFKCPSSQGWQPLLWRVIMELSPGTPTLGWNDYIHLSKPLHYTHWGIHKFQPLVISKSRVPSPLMIAFSSPVGMSLGHCLRVEEGKFSIYSTLRAQVETDASFSVLFPGSVTGWTSHTVRNSVHRSVYSQGRGQSWCSLHGMLRKVADDCLDLSPVKFCRIQMQL